VKGGLRDPEANLQLVVLPSHLEITILSHPPLMKVAHGGVAIVGVGRIRRRGRHRRCSIRGPTGPGERTKTVIHNKPVGESEQFIIINRQTKVSVLLHRTLASIVLAGHEGWLDLRKGKTKTATGLRQAEKSKGTVASGDVFEAKTTGWYLRT